ncbi:arcadin 1 [Infirmifilum lucidum]|uniref:Arcadin 1 n=1 Tax=Infirmifilum lucidum TaxID=2776706 RepID=A0A7L9FF33_9CREN|nr:arcadin 1 [Infirmifilum lucidum]QOJ78339.1 arcadin 1 [Infirmifilum lucidum]
MSSTSVHFKAKVTLIQTIDAPFGERMVKIELTEEREVPEPIFIRSTDSEISREIAPIISQIMKMLPGASPGVLRVPRVTIMLSEDEWEKFVTKPSIGDFFEVIITNERIELKGEG